MTSPKTMSDLVKSDVAAGATNTINQQIGPITGCHLFGTVIRAQKEDRR